MLPRIPLFPVPFWLAVLRLELLLSRLGLAFRVLPLLERELPERPLELVLRPLALLERVPPLLERAALERPPELVLRPLALLEPEARLRPPEAGFERDALPEAAAERPRDEAPPELRLALACDPEPLDDPRVPCPPLEAGLVAIPSPSVESVHKCTIGLPSRAAEQSVCRLFTVAVDSTGSG
jgi:hypothetical protein